MNIKMESNVFSFNTHRIKTQKDAIPIVKQSQESLHIENGPVFAVEVIDIEDGAQLIFLAAHHLSIDMVSWRVILQDLEELLGPAPTQLDKPLSFQAWCAAQLEHTKTLDTNKLLPFHEKHADLSYWDMEGHSNTYGEAQIVEFEMDTDITSQALGECHKTLRTEAIDLLSAAVLHSFARTFTDRSAPTLYSENHGREAWSKDIDLSRTVGWFTTVCPLVVTIRSGEYQNNICVTIYQKLTHLSGKGRDDILHTLRQTKDLRRRIPENGRPYFANKYLNSEDATSSSAGAQIELMFNYLGRSATSSEPSDSLFHQIDVSSTDEESKTTADVGTNTNRLALFEVSAIVTDGKLKFTFMYNRNLKKASQVQSWIRECRHSLEELISRLINMPPEPTLHDYPLMPINYEELKKLTSEVLPGKGITDMSIIEDMYPCSPVQEGLLISQIRDPKAYLFYAIFEVKHKVSGRIDPVRIGEAWQRVAARHPALRTVFIDSVYRGGMFDQVVVKKNSSVAYIECGDGEAVQKVNEASTQINEEAPVLPQNLVVCTTTTGRVIIKIKVNHVVIDGSSIGIILDDLNDAYESKLEEGAGPKYGDYIRYIKSQPEGSDTRFWMTYLNGIRPCHFPKLNDDPKAIKTLRSVEVMFSRYSELQQLSEKTKVTLAHILNVAWAMCLRKYTNSNDVAFGYLAAGREVPVENVQQTVGAFINMLCCRIQISESATPRDLFRTTQEEYLESIPYQRCSLALVQHDLGLSGKALYNTAISTQNHTRSSDKDENALTYMIEEAHDPSEVSAK
jgi:non-ribosomal peptide synthase protein (TIGR01720 family)